jgi:molybdopterin-guanine dinucleotide biosynthesis protein A
MPLKAKQRRGKQKSACSPKNPIGFSVAVLAGGESKRMMGTDKAFLIFRGVPFVAYITRQMLSISDDVYAIIGKKDIDQFRRVLADSIVIRTDTHDVANPVSGMLTACESVLHPLVAIIACDLPLVKRDLIKFLVTCAIGHSAAVPIWENGDIEPLCAAYNAEEFRAAALDAQRHHEIGCKNAVKYLRDVNYVPVSKLRKFDEKLESLFNVNSMKEFETLGS